MDELLTGAGAGGGGVLGVILAWFGFKSKICGVEKRLESLSKDVQYERTCGEIHKAINRRLEGIECAQRESGKDIKKILGQIKLGE